ncbi:MAG: right-handed parallel beta-helix repeat-containing protein [Kiritimatiellae bacterium]|nr:right-handed parallel beta-helix repeat-containing protein [Kiritimatiellia bacterium]
MRKSPCAALSMVCAAALLAGVAGRAGATDRPAPNSFFVDGAIGSDENPGTEAAPWKTVGKAFATVTAGATVHIAPGVYDEVYLKPANSGRPEARIVYTKWERPETRGRLGQYPVIGSDRSNRVTRVIELRDKTHITLEKLIITNPHPERDALLGPDAIKGNHHREGILIVGACRDIVIRQCQFLEIATRGILAGSGADWRLPKDQRPSPEVMDGNAFHDNKFLRVGMDTAAGDINFNFGIRHHIHHNLFKGFVDGVVYHHAASGSLIEQNTMLEHTREDGIDIKGTKRKSPLEEREQLWTVIRNNWVGRQVSGTGITIQYGCEHVKCYGNVVFGDEAPRGYVGLWLHASARTGGAKHVEIHDNVIMGLGAPLVYVKAHPEVQGKPELQHLISDVHIHHNTVAYGRAGGISVRSGKDIRVDHNLLVESGSTVPVHSDAQAVTVADNVFVSGPGDTGQKNVESDGSATQVGRASRPALGGRDGRPTSAARSSVHVQGKATDSAGARNTLKERTLDRDLPSRIFTVVGVRPVSRSEIEVRFSAPLRPATVQDLGVFRVWPKGRFDNMSMETIREQGRRDLELVERSLKRRGKIEPDALHRILRREAMKVRLEREEVAVLTSGGQCTYRELDGIEITRAELRDGNRTLHLRVDPPLQEGQAYELYLDHVSNEDGAFVDINPIDNRIHALTL